MITLATLHEATPQEIFDQVANHLLTQNEQCITPITKGCRYRYYNKKCAAGCLIDKDEYKRKFETKSWTMLVNRKWVSAHCDNLIRSLQQVHDRHEPDKWNNELLRVAEKYNLIFNY